MSREVPAAPPRVQIQTQSGCNGRCVFCPNAAVLQAGLPQGRMGAELFHKIVDELAELAPQRVSPYLMNEPLLDVRLPEFVRYISQKIPAATTLVTTNGANLEEGIAHGLIDAGLKRVKVSLQSLDPETNAKLMGSGVDAERVVRNVVGMQRLIRERRAELDLRVSMIVTKLNVHQIAETRRFWRKRGIRLVTSALENRGGNIKTANDLNPHEMKARGGYCVRPFREMCILFNGDAVLCCVDWFRTVVVGNAAEQSIREIWNGPRLKEIRAALENQTLENQPRLCVDCTESASPLSHRRGLRGLLARLLRGK